MYQIKLFNHNLRASGGFAGKTFGFDLTEANDAVFGGMDGEVAAEVGAGAGLFGFADLADEACTSRDFLAAEALHAEALTRGVVDVFA